jgi:pilus assembly protein CpaB
MLRRTESVALNLEAEPAAEAAPQAEGPVERRIGAEGIDALRARLQRELAARIDVGDPEPPPAQRFERAEPESPKPESPKPESPRPERRRIESLRAEAQKNTIIAPEKRSLGFAPGRRGRLRLSLSRVLLILVALVAGGSAAWLATRHDPATPKNGSQAVTAPKAAPEVVREPRVRILVAKQAIAVGQHLAANVDWEDWPKSALLPQYVTDAGMPDGKDPGGKNDMSGAIARFEIFPGEPIRTDKLALPGQGYLSAVLAGGMRGVSVAVSPEAASGGFILPSDHVDVVLTRNADNRTETILHNVRVVAINARLGQPDAPATASDKQGDGKPDDREGASKVFTDKALATLELDPAQTEVIINATAVGKLSLVLRALTDFPKADPGMRPTPNEAIRMTSPFWVK